MANIDNIKRTVSDFADITNDTDAKSICRYIVLSVNGAQGGDKNAYAKITAGIKMLGAFEPDMAAEFAHYNRNFMLKQINRRGKTPSHRPERAEKDKK